MTQDLYYYESGYIDDSYFVYTADAESQQTSTTSISCDANTIGGGVIVAGYSSVTAFATMTVTVSHIYGADLYGFSDAVLTAQASLIKETNAQLNGQFTVGISAVRGIYVQAQADSVVSVSSIASRTRGVEAAHSAAFSLSANCGILAEASSTELSAFNTGITCEIFKNSFAVLECVSLLNITVTKAVISQASLISTPSLSLTGRKLSRVLLPTVKSSDTDSTYAGLSFSSTTKKFGSSLRFDAKESSYQINSPAVYGPAGWLMLRPEGGVIISTDDGATWTKSTANFSEQAFTSSGYYAVLKYLNGKYIRTDSAYINDSTDGITWTSRGSSGIAFSDMTYANGYYIGTAGTSIFTSTNLAVSSWTSRVTTYYPYVGAQSSFNSIISSGTRSLMVGSITDANGSALTAPLVSYSSNGTTWTTVSVGASSGSAMINRGFSSVATDGTNWIAVGRDYTNNQVIIYSSTNTNLGSWTYVTSVAGSGYGAEISYGNGKWILIDNGSTWTSTNRSTWTAGPTVFATNGLIAYGSNDTWVVASAWTGSNSGSAVYVSTTTDGGTNWANVNLTPIIGNRQPQVKFPYAVYDSGDHSLDFWFYADSYTGNSTNYIRLFGNNVLRFTLSMTSGGLTIDCDYYSAPTSVTYNSWHHIRFVKSGTTYSWYVDGVRKKTGTSSFASNSDWINIGSVDGFTNNSLSSRGNVYLEEVYFTGTVLNTPATASFTVPTTPWTNTTTTKLLTHFDDNLTDDAPLIYVTTSAALSATASVSANISKSSPPTTVNLSSAFTISPKLIRNGYIAANISSTSTLSANAWKVKYGNANLVGPASSLSATLTEYFLQCEWRNYEDAGYPNTYDTTNRIGTTGTGYSINRGANRFTNYLVLAGLTTADNQLLSPGANNFTLEFYIHTSGSDTTEKRIFNSNFLEIWYGQPNGYHRLKFILTTSSGTYTYGSYLYGNPATDTLFSTTMLGLAFVRNGNTFTIYARDYPFSTNFRTLYAGTIAGTISSSGYAFLGSVDSSSNAHIPVVVDEFRLSIGYALYAGSTPTAPALPLKKSTSTVLTRFDNSLALDTGIVEFNAGLSSTASVSVSSNIVKVASATFDSIASQLTVAGRIRSFADLDVSETILTANADVIKEFSSSQNSQSTLSLVPTKQIGDIIVTLPVEAYFDSGADKYTGVDSQLTVNTSLTVTISKFASIVEVAEANTTLQVSSSVLKPFASVQQSTTSVSAVATKQLGVIQSHLSSQADIVTGAIKKSVASANLQVQGFELSDVNVNTRASANLSVASSLVVYTDSGKIGECFATATTALDCTVTKEIGVITSALDLSTSLELTPSVTRSDSASLQVQGFIVTANGRIRPEVADLVSSSSMVSNGVVLAQASSNISSSSEVNISITKQLGVITATLSSSSSISISGIVLPSGSVASYIESTLDITYDRLRDNSANLVVNAAELSATTVSRGLDAELTAISTLDITVLRIQELTATFDVISTDIAVINKIGNTLIDCSLTSSLTCDLGAVRRDVVLEVAQATLTVSASMIKGTSASCNLVSTITVNAGKRIVSSATLQVQGFELAFIRSIRLDNAESWKVTNENRVWRISRDINLDDAVTYRVPQETRSWSIPTETNYYTVAYENRTYKIKE